MHERSITYAFTPLGGFNLGYIIVSTIVIGATTIASFVYVLKRPQLTGSQKVGVLLAPMASEIPVGFLIFVPLTAVGLILFWDQGTSDQLAFVRGRAHGIPAESVARVLGFTSALIRNPANPKRNG